MADSFPDLAHDLRDRYVLERELGRGGMATVYLARDLKHGRLVALKVLQPALGASLGPDRFRREIALAARLQHPHICSVYDSGETNGSLWFAMPFVEGESLRDRLSREGRLPPHEALRITREAAQALQYAHDHGVVHRDVKPENILLAGDGATLVADFGIAHAVGTTAEQLTQTGMTLGTPAYMAPEQVTAEREVDGRADQYALAVTCWEMLAGRTPFTGPTPASILAARLRGEPPRAAGLVPGLPAELDAVIRRALALAPEDRFPSVRDFARALEAGGAPVPGAATLPAPARTESRRGRLAVGLALAAVLVAAGIWFRTRAAPADPAVTRLAVLPFENQGDSADAYFAEGVSDEVRGKLAGLPTLEVIARASLTQYRRGEKSPAQMGRELGVRYLLTGTVRWDKRSGGAGRVRVSPELIEASTGATRWQEPFEAPLTDVFQMQADIAGRVAVALDVALGGKERRTLEDRPTSSLPAYDAYLRGEAAWLGGADPEPAKVRRAAGLYRQAVELDSMFAAAWARLSQSHARLYAYVSPAPEDSAEARLAIERAAAIDPDRREVRLALALFYANVLRDERRSLETAVDGLQAFPDDPELLVKAAVSSIELGRVDEALRYLGRARSLDPRSARVVRALTVSLGVARRCPAAVAAAESLSALAPVPTSAYFVVQTQLICSGDLGLARAAIRSAYTHMDRDELLAYLAVNADMYWVPDDADRRRLEALPASAFSDRAAWALVQAELRWLRGDSSGMRAYADTARIEYGAQLRAAPDEPQALALRGLALAYLGRDAEATRDIQRARQIHPPSRARNLGVYFLELHARAHTLAGRRAAAVDLLEEILRQPYYITPAWLRVDPAFAALRGDPRFERLTRVSP